MAIRARCVFTEAEGEQQQKVQIGAGDSTIPKVDIFLSELLVLKISSKRRNQNLQLRLVTVQHQ